MDAQQFPIRLTICDTAEQAAAVVHDLKHAGFTPAEISVVCSEETCQQQFKPFVHEKPAGAYSSQALNVAGMGALGLGTAALIVGMFTTAGMAVMAIGAASGLAVAGTFAGLMSTRGVEKELADYYDQAVSHGKILVGVETHDPTKQATADQILGRGGSVEILPKEGFS